MCLRSAVRVTLKDVRRIDNWSILKLASDKCSWYGITVTYKGRRWTDNRSTLDLIANLCYTGKTEYTICIWFLVISGERDGGTHIETAREKLG